MCRTSLGASGRPTGAIRTTATTGLNYSPGWKRGPGRATVLTLGAVAWRGRAQSCFPTGDASSATDHSSTGGRAWSLQAGPQPQPHQPGPCPWPALCRPCARSGPPAREGRPGLLGTQASRRKEKAGSATRPTLRGHHESAQRLRSRRTTDGGPRPGPCPRSSRDARPERPERPGAGARQPTAGGAGGGDPAGCARSAPWAARGPGARRGWARRRRHLPRAHAAILRPLLARSKWPPGPAARPPEPGTGQGASARAVSAPLRPRPASGAPPARARALWPAGTSGSEGRGPYRALVHARCECVRAQQGLPSCFRSPESGGAGPGPEPFSGTPIRAGCAVPSERVRLWPLRTSGSPGRQRGEPGVQEAALEARTVRAAIYLAPTVCYAPCSAGLYHKAQQPVGVLFTPFSWASGKEETAAGPGEEGRLSGEPGKNPATHRRDPGISREPALETPRAEAGCRPTPWLWPLTFPPARPPTNGRTDGCRRRIRARQEGTEERGACRGVAVKQKRHIRAPPRPPRRAPRSTGRWGWGHTCPPGHDHSPARLLGALPPRYRPPRLPEGSLAKGGSLLPGAPYPPAGQASNHPGSGALPCAQGPAHLGEPASDRPRTTLASRTALLVTDPDSARARTQAILPKPNCWKCRTGARMASWRRPLHRASLSGSCSLRISEDTYSSPSPASQAWNSTPSPTLPRRGAPWSPDSSPSSGLSPVGMAGTGAGRWLVSSSMRLTVSWRFVSCGWTFQPQIQTFPCTP